MQSNPVSKNIIVPVIKRPRRELRIPRIDAHARLLAQRREDERIRALCEGTSPQVRELFRKIIFRAERLLEENYPYEQIIITIEGDLKTFEVLRPEFLLLLNRLWGLGMDKLCKAPVRVIAMILLYGIRLASQITKSAEKSQTNTSGGPKK
ncbi:MAG: hypothetical protein ABSD57_00270 [Verrucomicrobiota bacterium]|jgi:hypothetical protein